MKVLKLGDVLDVQNGFAFDSEFFSDEVGIPLIRIRDLKGGVSTDIKYKGNYSEAFKVKAGDYLIGMDGEFRCYKWKGEDGLLNQRVCRLINFSPDISPEYLYYGINLHLDRIERNTSFVTVKHISSRQIREIEFPFPSLEDQIRIATVLSKVEGLIAQRKESTRLLDDFLKSTFLEMFGDPVRNNKDWDTKVIEQLVLKNKHSIKRGPFGGALKKEIFVSDGYLVYEQFHALNDDFSFARYFITEEKFKELKAFEVTPGDIIISCSGVYLGKLAVVPDGARKGIINQALLKVSLDDSIVNKNFFVHLFRHESFKQAFFGDTRGSGIPNFPPMNDFKKFEFIYPPLKLQTQFAQVVDKVTAIKKIYTSSLEELENLFNSLSQFAFKGELDLNQMKVVVPYYVTSQNNKTEQVQKKESRHTKTVSTEAVETIAMQSVANKVIQNYRGFHFSFEMLSSFIEREKINYDEYFSSEEMKKNPKLNINPDNVEDLKNFVTSAIVNRTTDQQVPKNPWIKLNQIFYDASKPSASLNLKLEDLEKSSNRSIEDQSGIYFEIVS